MTFTSEASPTRSLRRLLLVPLIGLSSLAEAANPADEALMRGLQQQLQQVQATLQQLTEENRALRQHQEELDRKIAELSGATQPATPAAAAGPERNRRGRKSAQRDRPRAEALGLR